MSLFLEVLDSIASYLHVVMSFQIVGFFDNVAASILDKISANFSSTISLP